MSKAPTHSHPPTFFWNSPLHHHQPIYIPPFILLSTWQKILTIKQVNGFAFTSSVSKISKYYIIYYISIPPLPPPPPSPPPPISSWDPQRIGQRRLLVLPIVIPASQSRLSSPLNLEPCAASGPPKSWGFTTPHPANPSPPHLPPSLSLYIGQPL